MTEIESIEDSLKLYFSIKENWGTEAIGTFIHLLNKKLQYYESEY